MSIFKIFVLISFICLCSNGVAADIAHGTIKGIKAYDFSNSKVTRIYLNDDATRKTEASCNGVANITHSVHDEATAI